MVTFTPSILPPLSPTVQSAVQTIASDDEPARIPVEAPAKTEEKKEFDYFGKFLEGLQTSMNANATSAIEAEKQAAKTANDFTYKLFQEGNQFAADQAELAFQREQSSANKAMAFERSERLATQDFYERLSNTSYQRAVEDLKAAGLNPALAYSQGGSSSAMSSGASGSTASSGAPGSMSGSSAKANAASAKSADIRLMSGVIDGLVSVANNTLSSAVKLVSAIFPWL